MSDNDDSYYDDDYLWDIEQGFYEPSTGGGSDLPIVRIFLGGLIVSAFITSIFSLNVDEWPSAVFLIFFIGSCWLWSKIRKLF